MAKLVSIYRIRNLVNEKLYIGSSRWTQKRFNKHSALLNKGTHPNPHLQNAWNKYGKAAFVFELIEEFPLGIPETALREKEAALIKELDSINKGYNIALDTVAPMTGRKMPASMVENQRLRMLSFRHTEESKRKISESNRRRKGEKRSEEVRRRLSIAHLGKKHNMSPEGRAALAAAVKTRKYTPRRGWHWSDADRARLSESAKNRIISPEAKANRSKLLSENMKGRGWYNDGITMKRFLPMNVLPGFVLGKIKSVSPTGY